MRQYLTAPPPLARHWAPLQVTNRVRSTSADTLSLCEFLFAVRALHAGKGRGVPGGLDFDEFAVESAGDLPGLIIDRMDGPVWDVVTGFSRSDGVGANPMAAFGARLPGHGANRTRATAPGAATDVLDCPVNRSFGAHAHGRSKNRRALRGARE